MDSSKLDNLILLDKHSITAEIFLSLKQIEAHQDPKIFINGKLETLDEY